MAWLIYVFFYFLAGLATATLIVLYERIFGSYKKALAEIKTETRDYRVRELKSVYADNVRNVFFLGFFAWPIIVVLLVVVNIYTVWAKLVANSDL
jgi:hypothetical protein